ncbi:MAG: futalosine hydrolase [Bacteroidales bacterium]
MDILLIFATGREAEIAESVCGKGIKNGQCNYRGHNIHVLVTGVGGMATSWAMSKWLQANSGPGLAINCGIAGSFRPGIEIGDVVSVKSDCFGDLGIETDSSFKTLFEHGFIHSDEDPYNDGVLVNNSQLADKVSKLMPEVKAVTVNTASGSPHSVERLKSKFDPDIETMEGATFFYICLREKIPFLAIRAISNHVDTGRRGRWDIPLALNNLAGKLEDVLNII